MHSLDYVKWQVKSTQRLQVTIANPDLHIITAPSECRLAIQATLQPVAESDGMVRHIECHNTSRSSATTSDNRRNYVQPTVASPYQPLTSYLSEQSDPKLHIIKSCA